MISKQYKDVIRAAEAGGEIAKKYFGKSLKIEGKSMPCDFRTRADLESEKAVIKILSKAFPKHNIISEEIGEINKNSEYTFIIDPIDGTNNFVLGLPYFSTGIALVKNNQIIFSVVYDPTLKNIYFAEKGKGAYLNNKRIHVNKETNIKNSTISYVRNYKTAPEHSYKITEALENNGIKRVTKFWSVILDFCILATGKTEGIIIYGGIPLWDMAPGKLIAEEAGAKITEDGNSIFLASNGTKIHKELLEILNK